MILFYFIFSGLMFVFSCSDLSPGLAALTMGCDSGNLSSLSRVQLLLLDRPVPETGLSPSALDRVFSPVHDWPDLMVQDEDPDLSSAGRAVKKIKDSVVSSLGKTVWHVNARWKLSQIF